ncbi:MAG TPA: hypothetical protein VG367_21310 [Mucilaginibacter sp.]|jgi:hypothetical protein|nr:hypothetical protein [Mucilaginibacter sp.]
MNDEVTSAFDIRNSVFDIKSGRSLRAALSAYTPAGISRMAGIRYYR